jgi:glycosyltransferase involved in cell wall biosynthesis
MNLGVFFTYGISLKIWDELGLIDREILLYRSFDEQDIKIAFITYGNESDYQLKDKVGNIRIIPLYAFTKKPSNKILRFIKSFFLPIIMSSQLKEMDIIKTNQMSTTWTPIIAKLIFRKKLIVRCGFEWYRFMLRENPALIKKMYIYITEWLAYHIANGIILTSEDDKQYVMKKFSIINSEKIRVIPNYINTELFKPFADTYKKRDHLLFVGRLTEQKNLFNLISALKDGCYILDIVGGGKLKENLMRFATDNKVVVNFLENIPNNKIPELLNQYEIFVLPSLYEGNPKALLEAMSCGLAVIGTDVDGIRDIIKHRENGYLCNTNSESIREAVEVVMHDKCLREKMGAQAREYVIRNCSIDTVIKKEIELYNSLL